MKSDIYIVVIVFIFAISIMPLKYIENSIASLVSFDRDTNIAFVALINGLIVGILSYLILRITKSKKPVNSAILLALLVAEMCIYGNSGKFPHVTVIAAFFLMFFLPYSEISN